MLILLTMLILEVYPRVGGGNTTSRPRMWATDGLSPRGRGKRRVNARPCLQARSIPAWAGETSTSAPKTAAMEVYPRVGGGNTP